MLRSNPPNAGPIRELCERLCFRFIFNDLIPDVSFSTTPVPKIALQFSMRMAIALIIWENCMHVGEKRLGAHTTAMFFTVILFFPECVDSSCRNVMMNASTALFTFGRVENRNLYFSFFALGASFFSAISSTVELCEEGMIGFLRSLKNFLSTPAASWTSFSSTVLPFSYASWIFCISAWWPGTRNKPSVSSPNFRRNSIRSLQTFGISSPLLLSTAFVSRPPKSL
mmetsp:Transcript_23617/g.57213  ORF Transcript_23617/g.57213 Transcript_23617/m.57213 type:complete len:226 (-) Transcript_23617:603-1280(-)